VIHGVAFRQEDFKDMAANGVSLVWSPRSNYELYGATTRIQEAKGSGVTIALAPDWSPTGSAGMLQELRYVADWNQQNKVFQDSELIEMTTSIPAEIAGLGDELGTLAPGRQADLLVLKSSNKSAFATVLSAGLPKSSWLLSEAHRCTAMSREWPSCCQRPTSRHSQSAVWKKRYMWVTFRQRGAPPRSHLPKSACV
jgi:cytosine/adenosine deaminase-related metal-dependent hydrolase